VTDPTPARDLTPESEALVNDWAEYEFAGMDDPTDTIRARLAAIEAAARADEATALRAEVERLRLVIAGAFQDLCQPTT